jgi:thioredoxin reductase/NAD-dependent dihydropyrimidine dehydrogenase PreA subunit
MKAAGTFAHSGLSGAVSSDVQRRRRIARLLLGVAVVALVAVVVGLMGSRAKLAASASPGPLSRGHLSAGLTCASCHTADGAAAATSCSGCHVADAHRSSRAPHRALAAANGGALACVACHAAHGSAAGVDLDGEQATVWRGAASWTVPLEAPAPRAHLPLVPRAACARCHDTASARDPAARCFSAGAVYSGCFDEHAKAPSYAVVDAARRAADRVPALSQGSAPPSSSALSSPDVHVAAAALLAGLALCFWPATRRRVRLATSVAAAPAGAVAAPEPSVAAVAVRRLPIIDASRCLGCRACVDACAFDVLEVERFVAQVVRPDACCGAVTCETACPNGSLTLVPVDATDDASGAPRAHLDGALESPDAPMVFLAGDLTGVPLIKHAIRQGRLVADRVAAKLPRRTGSAAEVHDVVVVGAGPAGLSATLRARELGLSVVALEQGQIGASIRAFPRGKLVFERPLELPLEGELWMEECTKEELVAQWERVVRVHRLPVRPGHRVSAIERLPEESAARYRLTVTRGEGESDAPPPVHLSARALILALGTRGTPRPLPAPVDPAAVARIAYALVDAASFADRRVLVVGLGDSAMEAALALARQPGCQVTVLARGAAFTRGSARTLRELQEAVSAGRIALHFGATVTAVTACGGAAEAHVTVGTAAPVTLPFDQMFVFIGGTGPWALLEQAGVVIRGHS